MSEAASTLSPPEGNSRSSSPGNGDPKPRVISGSLKDRIAKFSDPSAAPLIPNAYGNKSRNVSSGQMIGNRIPTLDPKTAGIVAGARRVKEDRGMIGNRIPSASRTYPASDGRSASPVPSVDSSGHADSNSPITSRSSSPPTSTGDEETLPAALLNATLPDTGGPGAQTPSSTRAEAGEDTSNRSAPSTPMQGPIDLTMRGGHYDLSEPNVKMAGKQVPTEMGRTPSMQSGAGALAAPSITASLGSSRASQYDPSSQGSENPEKMMRDVSEVSTPTGTPRAALQELDGSMRGEGSVAGDEPGDMTARLGGLQLDVPDRDPTPEPIQHAGEDKAKDIVGEPLDNDPNKDDDLDALKSGELSSAKGPAGTHTIDQNPINNVAEAGVAQGLAEYDVTPEQLKHQGGVAGQRMEEVEKQDEVEAPTTEGGSQNYAGSDTLGVRTASSPSGGASGNAGSEETGSMITDTDTTRNDIDMMPNVVQGARAAGTRLDESGAGPMTSGDTDYLKEALNEDRKKQAEKAAANEDEAHVMQTEQDRDEGVNRREQLVKALDQNADPDKDLQGDVDKETKARAREATSNMTGAQPRQKDEDEEVQPEEGAQTPRSEEPSQEGGDGAETPKSGGTPKSTSRALDSKSQDGNEGAEQGNPLQVHIEPAPVAQPAEEGTAAAREQSITPTPPSPTQNSVDPPSFPAPPTEDPDVADPDSIDSATPSTPIDSSFLKTFPDVPDEEKPRVQVHVSSPHNTPQKSIPEPKAQDPAEETPIAHIPGHSKSLSNPPETTPQDLASPETGRRDSLGPDETPKETTNLQKRNSARRSPKSPLLDDEDPGDFEAGEGWATIHEVPGRNRD